MANSTLLQIVDKAVAEMGLLATVPTTVIANTDMMVVQFLNLLNGLGDDLVREYEWQAITKQYTFTTIFYQYTATTVLDSTTLSALSSTTGLTASPTYFTVTGTGIPQDTQLVSVNGGASTAVMSNAATASGSATLTFSQTRYDMPSDFDRLIDQTQWDKSDHWELLGPTSAQGWEWLKSGYIATGPRARFRVLANLFQVWPPCSDNLLFGFEYMRKNWVLVTAGTDVSKASFTVDTDTCIFPDRLIIESLKLRFRKENGRLLPTYNDEDIAKGFITRLADLAKTSDAGNPILSMAGQRTSILIGPQNIQDGNYNIP